ncbi:MAG: 2-dehydropantoate 2-reductase [Chloroflexi bacterium]|nr:2-dehydropantoate 2-reductase [Chloroflexota bacterium]
MSETQPMRVLVVGAGAVGTWFAHRFGRAGHHVAIVGRPAYVEAVRERGLGLAEAHEPDPTWVTTVQAHGGLSEVAGQSFDLVAMTMKAYDTGPAVAELSQLGIRWRLPLVLVQNGVGTEEMVSETLWRGAVCALCTTRAMTQVEPGVVRMHSAKGGLVLAPTAPGQSVAEAAELFREAGFLNVRTHHDHRAVRWSKLLLNLVGGAQSAILDWAPPQMFRDRRLVALTLEALREATAVMRRLDVEPVSLPSYPTYLFVLLAEALPSWLAQPILRRLVARGRGEKLPALQQDLMRGKKRLEVEVLNGAVSSYGKTVGVPTPVNDVLYRTLSGIARGQVAWEEYRGHPERLLQAVEARRQEVAATPQGRGWLYSLWRWVVRQMGGKVS